jgi:hypothetical protein
MVRPQHWDTISMNNRKAAREKIYHNQESNIIVNEVEQCSYRATHRGTADFQEKCTGHSVEKE